MPQPVPSQNFQLQPRYNLGLGLGMGLGQGLQSAVGTAFGSGLELLKEAINPDPRLEAARLANEDTKRTAISKQIAQGVTDPKQLAQMFDLSEEEVGNYLNNPTLQNMAKDAQHASRLRARWENRVNSLLPSEDPNPLSESDHKKWEQGNLKRSGVLNGAAQMTKGYQSQQGTGGVTDSLIGGQDQVDATGSEHSPTAEFVSASDPAEMARSVLAPDSPEFKAEQDRIRKHLAAAPERLNQAIRNESTYRSYLLEQYRQEQERNSDVFTAHFSGQYMPRNNMDSYRDRSISTMDQAMFREYIQTKAAKMGILPDVLDKIPLGDMSVYLDNAQNGKVDALKLLAANYESTGSPEGIKAAKEIRLRVADMESQIANAQSILAGMSTRDQMSVFTALKSIAPLLAQSPGKANMLNSVATGVMKSSDDQAKIESSEHIAQAKIKSNEDQTKLKEDRKDWRQGRSLEQKGKIAKANLDLAQGNLAARNREIDIKKDINQSKLQFNREKWEKDNSYREAALEQTNRRLDLMESHFKAMGDKNKIDEFKRLKDYSTTVTKAVNSAWRDYDSKRKDAEKFANPDPVLLHQVNEAKRRYEEVFSRWREIDEKMQKYVGQ